MTLSPFAARALMAIGLLPFLWYASRDQLLHFSARKVPRVENLLHFALGVVLAITIAQAFRFDVRRFALFAVVFAFLGALDEFVFHRGIPDSESDTHAKEHFTLLAFFAIAVFILQWT